jgi:hypothetical protein
VIKVFIEVDLIGIRTKTNMRLSRMQVLRPKGFTYLVSFVQLQGHKQVVLQ